MPKTTQRYIVIPYFGNPFLLPDEKKSDSEWLKVFQEICEGYIESAIPKDRFIIHPMFRNEDKSWDIVGKLFESGNTVIYCNEEGMCPGNNVTPNMATVRIDWPEWLDKSECRGGLAHLWGRIIVKVSQKVIDKAGIEQYIQTKTLQQHIDGCDDD